MKTRKDSFYRACFWMWMGATVVKPVNKAFWVTVDDRIKKAKAEKAAS